VASSQQPTEESDHRKKHEALRSDDDNDHFVGRGSPSRSSGEEAPAKARPVASHADREPTHGALDAAGSPDPPIASLAAQAQTSVASAGGASRPPAFERKAPVVRCSAMNDDEEDFGTLFDQKPPGRQLHKDRSTDAEADAQGPPQGPPAAAPVAATRAAEGVTKKEKEFAWMDSDDEGEDEPAAGGSQVAPAEKQEEPPDKGTSDNDEEPVTAESLDEVSTFGRMVLLAPAIQKWLRSGSIGAPGAMATIRALARTTFFDGDLLEELHKVLRRLLQAGALEATQVDDAICCFRTLNAYDSGFFSAVARAYKSRTRDLQATLRHSWIEAMVGFGHTADPDFLQLLEVPALPSNSPAFRKVRCWHLSKGGCVLEAACSFSHDPGAPLSLAEGGNEDWWRSKPLVMTQNQRSLGHGTYGTANIPPPPPASLQVPQVPAALSHMAMAAGGGVAAIGGWPGGPMGPGMPPGMASMMSQRIPQGMIPGMAHSLPQSM